MILYCTFRLIYYWAVTIETGQSLQGISLNYFLQLHVDLPLCQLKLQIKNNILFFIDAETTFHDALTLTVRWGNINWGYIHILLNILNHVSRAIKWSVLGFDANGVNFTDIGKSYITFK